MKVKVSLMLVLYLMTSTNVRKYFNEILLIVGKL